MMSSNLDKLRSLLCYSSKELNDIVVHGYIRNIMDEAPLDIINLCFAYVVNVCDNKLWKRNGNVVLPFFKASISGRHNTIQIGKNVIIGCNVQIIAENGSIKIGDNNIIQDGTLIINKNKDKKTLTIGNSNLFECGSS